MGWDTFKNKANEPKVSDYEKTRVEVKNQMAGLMRKLKFDAMVHGGTEMKQALKQVGVKVPFGRRITPLEAQRAAENGALKKRAY